MIKEYLGKGNSSCMVLMKGKILIHIQCKNKILIKKRFLPKKSYIMIELQRVLTKYGIKYHCM